MVTWRRFSDTEVLIRVPGGPCGFLLQKESEHTLVRPIWRGGSTFLKCISWTVNFNEGPSLQADLRAKKELMLQLRRRLKWKQISAIYTKVNIQL